jgi:hypothetical protein
MQTWVKVIVACFFAAPVLMYVADRPMLFDVFLIGSAGYALTGWVPVRPEERRAFYAEYRRWSAALAG